jgi:hypothetical protein
LRVLVLLLGIAGWGLAATRADPIRSFPVWILGVGVATAAWLLAARATGRGVGFPFVVVAAGAILARAVALVPEPLSDDLYRYLWDGRVANAGVDPFLHAPDADELAALRDTEVWPRVNHPEIPTIYPPAAQALFRAQDRWWPDPMGVRVWMLTADLAAFGLVAWLLRKSGRDPALAVWHGWCPLVIWESAGSGHVDAAGVALVLAALACGTTRGRSLLAGALFGLSAQVKPMSPFLAPMLWREKRARWPMLAGAVVSLALFLPHLGVGTRVWTGFLAYAEHWHFNDCFYSFLVRGGVGPRTARAVLAVALAGTAILVPRRAGDPMAVTGIVFGAVLFFSPTVHPWYAVWLVPFLVFLPPPIRRVAVALVALLPLSYVVYWQQSRTGVWHEPAWLWLVVWGPVSALGAWSALGARLERPVR